MALRNAYRLRWQPRGLSDSLDGNNSPPGAMARLSNLIVDPRTDTSWVPRPAATLKTNFLRDPTFWDQALWDVGFWDGQGSGIATSGSGFISGMLVVGDMVYGMVATGRNPGHDEPFAYNAHTGAFHTVAGVTAGNTPVSPPTDGDWTPPILAQVGTKVVVTHPGFPGGAIKFGWFDVSGFTSSSLTGTTTVGSPILTAMSSSPILAGWTAGMSLTGAGIPAGTTIVSVTSTTVTLSANATAAAAGVAFTVAGGTVASPQWAAGDLSVFPLPSVPVSVVQFSGRAYYACGINGVVFSDTLNATNRTNANQALLTGDGLPVTALGPLMLSTQVVGGIVQGIIAFQGNNKMQQITGDYATLNLAMNALPVATGTNAPLSIVPIPTGLAFISNHGLRVVATSGQVSPPIGDAGTGISQPFIYATTPTRICAAASADVLRISVRRGDLMDNPTQEFWYDLTRQVWNGPHTFPASLIQPWRDTFIMTPFGINAQLWQSDPNPSPTTTYVENGVQLRWQYQPVLLPDDQDMHMIAIIQSSITIAVATNQVNAQMIDDLGITRDTTMFPPDQGLPTLWDVGLWDVGIWDGQGAGIYRQRAMHWHVPLVAKQLTFRLSADSAAGLRVGNLSLRYQRLGYMLEVA
jgi:hypothetical protein